MEQTKPVKRHVALQSFSREHRIELLIGWKIRQGFRKNVSLSRIKKYTDWVFKNYVKPHFENEEKYILPLLDESDKIRKRIITEHRRLERLFNDNEDVKRALSLIEEELDAHIRYEEKVLFEKIQEIATEAQLEEIQRFHYEIKENENWNDKFWV